MHWFRRQTWQIGLREKVELEGLHQTWPLNVLVRKLLKVNQWTLAKSLAKVGLREFYQETCFSQHSWWHSWRAF